MYNARYLLSSATEWATTQCNEREDSNPISTQHSPILAAVTC